MAVDDAPGCSAIKVLLYLSRQLLLAPYISEGPQEVLQALKVYLRIMDWEASQKV